MRPGAPTAGIIELRRTEGARAPFIVGAAFLVFATLFAIAGVTSSTRVHPGGVAALAAIGIALASWGRPRSSVLRIDPARRTLAVSGSPEAPLGEGAVLRLGAALPVHASAPSRYGVFLERKDGPALPWVEGEDPADVLRRLLVLRTSLALPVVGGWGLSVGSPWIDEMNGPGPPALERRASTETRETRQRIATTILVGAATVGLILAVELRGPVGSAPGFRFVSVLLPLLGIAVLLTVGLAIRTDEKRLTLGADFVAERRVFGIPWSRRAVPRGEIRDAYLVSPDGRSPRHLLLETEKGPIAFCCEPEEGELLRNALATAPR